MLSGGPSAEPPACHARYFVILVTRWAEEITNSLDRRLHFRRWQKGWRLRNWLAVNQELQIISHAWPVPPSNTPCGRLQRHNSPAFQMPRAMLYRGNVWALSAREVLAQFIVRFMIRSGTGQYGSTTSPSARSRSPDPPHVARTEPTTRSTSPVSVLSRPEANSPKAIDS